MEKPNHRHRQLLRAYRKRPRAAAAPPSSVMNLCRLMSSIGLPPSNRANPPQL